jgi:hypothetical protein
MRCLVSITSLDKLVKMLLVFVKARNKITLIN